MSRETPTRLPLFTRLWATLLIVVFGSAWALPLLARVEQQSERMACCRKGKLHSCCKRSQNKSKGSALVSKAACGSRCAVPSLASVRTTVVEDVSAQRYVWALAPTGLDLPASDTPHFETSRFYELYQRPPPLPLV